MLAWPREFIDELKSRNDILSVVSQYVQLRQRSRTWQGKCPFHDDSSPSFCVYPHTNSFFCFGCHESGDVINFVAKINNYGRFEAIKELAERSGLEIPSGGYEQNEQERDMKLRILEANREAARYYNSVLATPVGRAGLKYLRETRGLGENTIRGFGLGFAPDSWSSLTDHLMKKGFGAGELVEANLSVRNKNGGYYDRFRNRVMFPIIDTSGKVIAFGGRGMGDEKPKYLNTSDTPVYKKMNNLYGINRAKKTKEDSFILCEGYMDVIAIHQAGFDNAVAGLGTALTENQVKLIRRYKDNVILCYDSDGAGQKAAARAIEMFDKVGVTVKVLRVPDGKDPDGFIKKNGQNGHIKFKQLIEHAEDECSYMYRSFTEKYNIQTPDGEVKILSEAAKFIGSLSSPLKQEVYSGRISEAMGIKRTALDSAAAAETEAKKRRESGMGYDTSEKRGSALSSLPVENREGAQETAVSKKSLKAEYILLAGLITHPELSAGVSRRLTGDEFSTKFTSDVYGAIFKILGEGGIPDITGITNELGGGGDVSSNIAAILAEFNSTTSAGTINEVCDDCVNVILGENRKKSKDEISQMSDDEAMKYLTERKEADSKRT